MSFAARLSRAWFALHEPARAPTPPAAVTDDAKLAADSALAAARLDADDIRAQLAACRRELDAERASRSDAIASAVAARVEPVFDDAAALVGQLALQSWLIDEGKPVTARDVMALALPLGRTFHKLGLTPLAAPGECVAFDPERHQPLSGAAPAPSANVEVRVPGFALGEKIVRKSLVQPA